MIGCQYENRRFNEKERNDTNGCVYFTHPLFRGAATILAIIEIILIATFMNVDRQAIIDELESFNKGFVGCFDYDSAVYFDQYEAEKQIADLDTQVKSKWIISLLVFHIVCNIVFVYTHGVAVIEQRRIGDNGEDPNPKPEEKKVEEDNAPPEIGTVEWAKQQKYGTPVDKDEKAKEAIN